MTVQRRGMTEREYARHLGLSRGAVQRARMAGRLVLFPDGSIDARASDIRRAHNIDSSKQRGRHAPAMKPVPVTAVGTVNETLKEQALPSAGGLTFLQARNANEVLKAQERRIRLQKLKGDVVDRAEATALVFRLARQERDAWVGWPARVAAIIAAEVGIGAHAMQTILERHVRDHLEELAEIRPDFR